MGPPQLHVVLIGLRRLAQGVDEVEQSAVLLVPAGLNGPIEHLGRPLHQLLVPGPLGVLQQEPDALNVVARVHRAALGVEEPGLPVLSHVLQHAFELRLHVVAEDVLHALPRPLLIERLALGVRAQQDACDVENNHGDAEGTARAGLGDGLGAHGHRVRLALAQIPVEVIALPRPLQPLLLPCYPVVLRVGRGAEGLGEVVAPLAQGPALRRDGEVHPVSGGVVEAVGLHEVQAAAAGLQPLRPCAVGTA